MCWRSTSTGTLTNDQKVVTPATRTALDAAAAKGVTIVLASGRPTAGVVPLARELELDKKGGCILSYNGGSITDCATRQDALQPVAGFKICAGPLCLCQGAEGGHRHIQ